MLVCRPIAEETNSWAKCGMQSRATSPMMSAATGTSRQPRTVRDSSAAIRSIASTVAARSASSIGQEGETDGVRAGAGQR